MGKTADWRSVISSTSTKAVKGVRTSLAGENVDLEVMHRLKAEAFNNSQVMDHLFFLTDVNGPRLTGSPGFISAAKWAQGEFEKIGLSNAHLEKWGPFGRGWSYSSFSMAMQKPVFTPLHGTPLAWCEGTKGPVRGTVVTTSLFHEDESRRNIDIATVRERIDEYREGRRRHRSCRCGTPRHAGFAGRGRTAGFSARGFGIGGSAQRIGIRNGRARARFFRRP